MNTSALIEEKVSAMQLLARIESQILVNRTRVEEVRGELADKIEAKRKLKKTLRNISSQLKVSRERDALTAKKRNHTERRLTRKTPSGKRR